MYSNIVTLMMGTEMVCETLVVFNEMTQLIAQEELIDVLAIIMVMKLMCKDMNMRSVPKKHIQATLDYRGVMERGSHR
jgi:hypothetical protein